MNSKDLPAIPIGQKSEWFHERYEAAAVQIIEFLSEDFLSPRGNDVADIGCGDGIIDLGVVNKGRPRRLVGFDITPTDEVRLSALAAEQGLDPHLPAELEFRTCLPQKLPAEDESFDLAFSWAAFHLMEAPLSMIHEVRRILRPGGGLMVHLYPLFHSQHGSLLEPWFPDGFAQFLYDDQEVSRSVRANPGQDPAWAERMLLASRTTNRMTVDELGRLLRAARFAVRRIHLITEDTKVPDAVAHLPLSQLGVGGVRLTAQAI